MKVLLAVVVVAAVTACSGGERWGAPDATETGGQEPRRGGWDANSGNWNGNLGSWETLSGIGMNPTWAPDGTGPGTLTNAMVFGIQRTAGSSQLPCDPPTADVTDVLFHSSSGGMGAALGPDVEVVRGRERGPLAMNEEVVFAGKAYDGYLRNIEITARVKRVDTLVKADALWYAWPVFELQLCENARRHRGYIHLGYVSWAPMMTLPEQTGAGFVFHPDIVMPVTTVPRPEYADDPAVPSAVQHQTGALWFKFAFYASLPVGLRDEPALAFTTSAGATIENNAFLRDGALALGNASWVHPVEEDGVAEAARHRFPAFFTQDGTEVAMFAVGRGTGPSHGELRYPASWSGQKIGALELTAAELDLAASYSLDAIHGRASAALMGPLDSHARLPTHLGSGPGTFRVGRYLNGSPSPHRLDFYWQRHDNIDQTYWASPLQSPIDGVVAPEDPRSSQERLRTLVRFATSPVDYAIAGESPRPPGKPDFNSGMLVPPTPTVDAGVDAAPVDAATDAPPVDAAPIDAPPVDAAPIDAPPVDAAPIDAPPVDAAPIDAPLIDAGIDGASVDGPTPPDAGTDAGTDADTDADTDAGTDADTDADTDAGTDADVFDAVIEGPG